MFELRRHRVTTVTNTRSVESRSAGVAPAGSPGAATPRHRTPKIHRVARAAGRARGLLPAVALTFALGLATSACGSHGTPEEVAAACEHQLSVAKRDAIAAHMRARGEDPTTRAGLASLEAELRAALAEASAQQSLSRCRTLYTDLSSDRIQCILGADDPVAINACMPQADRKR